MKLLLFASILCCAISLGFGLRATSLQCLKRVPSWSEINCQPHKEKVFATLDNVWAGNEIEEIGKWLNNPIPPEWTEQDLMDYCLYRECRVNQAMVDYMNLHGYPPYCMEQSPEEWINDRYWVRCKVRVNKTIELTPKEFSVYFCFKAYHQQQPTIPCPSFEEIMNPNHPRIQEMQKAKEVITDDAEPESEQWWVGLMRYISQNSAEKDHVPAFHYGWIINMDENDYKHMVPLWSPYQGPTVPVRRDFPRIVAAAKNDGGDITLGDYRHFHCAPGSHGCLRCEEFGPLAMYPRETIVLKPTIKHIVMAMTQHKHKVRQLERAVWKGAGKLKSHEYAHSIGKSHVGLDLSASLGE
uniref:Luciferase 3 n=1 Tax=Odontosyllis octodentata TaxID=2336528 RepID=A0A5A4PVT3_9ANNE|nr:luciferase 3 [Odontosyllis octodentata]